MSYNQQHKSLLIHKKNTFSNIKRLCLKQKKLGELRDLILSAFFHGLKLLADFAYGRYLFSA